MRKSVFPLFIFITFCAGIVISSESCNHTSEGKEVVDSLAIKKHLSSPVVSPQAAIQKMHVEKGFAVKLVAAEPMLTAPVALTFDEKGRMWVLEMPDYMPDTLGTGESKPTGKIVILTDTNGDGVMDSSKVFLDSLVLPRAICLIDNGVLVGESPNLWFYEIENDRPVKKTLVDDHYTQGGNVEHEPNGLIRALDNWIYSAKFDKRYRKKGNRWIKEKTHFRGQWGITQDDEGRLYYNTNSENLLGDYFSPGLGATNSHQRSVAGFNENIVPDNKVYPVRPTPGVNRGYMEGVLDDSLRLVNFTAACGPVFYNGNLFGNAYSGNVFVAEPSANLIKRNILSDSGYRITGREAYANHEFLASEDERFRPVNLYVGPDGALYIVDMYRGIIQHKTYLTSYLKNEIKERSLTQPLNCGRIYKVVPQNSKAESAIIANDPNQLIALLQDSNAWVRYKAQQLLIDGKFTQAIPSLRDNLTAANNPLTVVHSLWTLEGLNALQANDVLPLLQQQDWRIRMQALSVLPSILNKKNLQRFLPVLRKMIDQNDTLAAPYIAYVTNTIKKINPSAGNQFLTTLAKKYPNNIFVADAIISNLFDKEKSFYKRLLRLHTDTTAVIVKRLQKVMDDIEKAKNSANSKNVAKQFPKGAALFQSTCQACHGADGNGIQSLAPPLNNSEWVNENKRSLISIVLYGLTGPVPVNGKVYQAPEINGDMPSIGQNKEFSDEDIAQVLSFIRNSWNNKAKPVTAADVTTMRNQYKGRQKSFTIEELKKQK